MQRGVGSFWNDAEGPHAAAVGPRQVLGKEDALVPAYRGQSSSEVNLGGLEHVLLGYEGVSWLGVGVRCPALTYYSCRIGLVVCFQHFADRQGGDE